MPGSGGLGRQRAALGGGAAVGGQPARCGPLRRHARCKPIEGPGAAFSLAATPRRRRHRLRAGRAAARGDAAVRLPRPPGKPGAGPGRSGARSTSARRRAWVPSRARRVVWRVTAGEGKLPHPWVTALRARTRTAARRHLGRRPRGAQRRRRADAAARAAGPLGQSFAETEGLKISPARSASASGRAWAGTDGDGLWRRSRDRRALRTRAAGACPPRASPRCWPSPACCASGPTRGSPACRSAPRTSRSTPMTTARSTWRQPCARPALLGARPRPGARPGGPAGADQHRAARCVGALAARDDDRGRRSRAATRG